MASDPISKWANEAQRKESIEYKKYKMGFWNISDEIAKLQSENYTRIQLRDELRQLYVLLSKEELIEELKLTEQKLKTINNGTNTSI